MADVELPGAELRFKLPLTPVPDSGMVCGLLLALSAIVDVPNRLPRVVGAKVTLIEQFWPAFTADPQVLVSLKSPEIEMREMLSVTCPVFVSVTASGELVCPTIVSGKDRLVGLRVTAGAAPDPSDELREDFPKNCL